MPPQLTFTQNRKKIPLSKLMTFRKLYTIENTTTTATDLMMF